MPSIEPDAVAAVLRRRASTSGPFWLDVDGASMGRSIASGSRVLVAPSTARPRRGEVWAFCDPEGAVVVHRCRGRGEVGWVFQGDNRDGADRPVPDDHLVGPVVAVADRDGAERRVGRFDRHVGGTRVGLRRAATVARRAGARVRGALRGR